MTTNKFWLYAAMGALAVQIDKRVFEGKSSDTSPETACEKAIEQEQEFLFPRNRFYEIEGFIALYGGGFGLNTKKMEQEVSDYEVGRATAMQIAISDSRGFEECREPPADATE